MYDSLIWHTRLGKIIARANFNDCQVLGWGGALRAKYQEKPTGADDCIPDLEYDGVYVQCFLYKSQIVIFL